MTAGVTWRRRQVVVPAVVAVVALGLGLALAWSGRSDGAGGTADLEPIPDMPTTTLATGGIEVAAPEGWTVMPVPDLQVGLAVPPGWEATVLSEAALINLQRSTPGVPGFLEAAHAAANSGSVIYAAGEGGDGRVDDLKVRAAPGAGVSDEAGLLAYAEQVASDGGLDGAVEPVAGAERPTVRIGFTSEATSPEGDAVAVVGTETLVAGPGDIVWSLIVTSEDAEAHDALVADILETLTLPER